MTVYTVAASTIHDYQVRLLDLMRHAGITGPVEYAYRTERGPFGQRWSEDDFRRSHLRPADGRTIFDNEVVLDFDIQKYEAWEILAGEFNQVVSKLQGAGIPHWPAYSGGNGAHIHIFFDTDNLERAIAPRIVRYSIAKALVKWIGDARIDYEWLRARGFTEEGKGHLIREYGSGKETYFSKTVVDQLPSDRTMLLEQLRFPEHLEVWTIPQWFIDRDGELLEDLRKGCRGTGYAPAEYQYVVYKHPEEQEFPQWLGEAACPERSWSDSVLPPPGVSTEWISWLLYTGDAMYLREAANQVSMLVSREEQACLERSRWELPEYAGQFCEGVALAVDEVRSEVVDAITRFAEGAVRRRESTPRPAPPKPSPEQFAAVVRAEVNKTIIPFLEGLLKYAKDSAMLAERDWTATWAPENKVQYRGRLYIWASLVSVLDFYIHYLRTSFETTFRPPQPWFPPR